MSNPSPGAPTVRSPQQEIVGAPFTSQGTILVDTREQCPLSFDGFAVEVVGLPVGDYGLEGFSDWDNPAFIVERKSLEDLVGSLTSGRERFMREVEKLRQFRFAAIIVEAHRGELELGQYRSAATPQSILASLAAIQIRAGVHVIWTGDRERAAREVERLARQFIRGIEKDARRVAAMTTVHTTDEGAML